MNPISDQGAPHVTIRSRLVSAVVLKLRAACERAGAGAPSGRGATTVGSARLVVLLASTICALLAFGAGPAFALTTHELAFTFNGSDAPSGPFAEVGADAVDQASGDVYVLDWGAGVVDKFNADGTYAGVQITGASTPQRSFSLSYPGGVAVDNSGGANNGDVYVADTGNKVVDRFSATGTYLCQITGSATPSASECNGASGSQTPAGSLSPAGVAVDSSGDVYVADSANDVVDEFGPAGNYIGQISNPNITSPGTIALDSSGNLYLTNVFSNVVEFSAAGAFVGTLDSNSSNSVGVDPANGHVYVQDPSQISEYDSSGTLVDTFGSGQVGQFVLGLAVDGATGQIYASDYSNGVVEVFGVVVIPDVTTGQASSVTTAGATLNGTVNPDGTTITDCQFDYVDDADYSGSAPDPYSAGSTVPCSTTPSGSSPVAVSATVTGLSLDTRYHFRLEATNSSGTSAGSDQMFTTSGPPSVDGESVSAVGTTYATLNAQINPYGLDTTYHFEYGTDDCATSTCTSVPVPDADIGSGTSDVSVSEQIAGLSASTTYYYRLVAHNTYGTTPGPDRTFETFAPAGALPDGRSYELVSPGTECCGEVYEPGEILVTPNPTFLPFQAAADGDAVAYVGDPSPTGNGNEGLSGGNEYLATRTPSGWSAQDIQPPGLFSPSYQAFSSDLSLSFLDACDVPLTPDAPGGGYDVLYTRDNAAGSYDPVFTTTPPNRSASGFGSPGTLNHGNCKGIAYAGASADGSHVLFEANDALTAGAPDPGVGADDLYDSVGGQPQLVNVLPDGTAAPNASFGSPSPDNGVSDPPDFSHVISADGSRIFWTDLNNNKLYVRENATTTVQLDAPAPGAPGPGGGGLFWTASTDGSTAVFTDDASAGLTSDTQSGSGQNVYEWDDGTLTDLTPASDAGVLGVLGASDDASYVYFVANGVLASGASAGDCASGGGGGSGTCSLYLWHDFTTTYIATLADGDGQNFGYYANGDFGDWQPGLGNHTAEVTPDGGDLMFLSTQSLTGYDNQGLAEVYVYDAGSGRLSCASCDPTGEPPPTTVNGSTVYYAAFEPVSYSQTYQPRWMSDDGDRVFFDSVVPLTLQATDGQQNVYEWERDGTGSCDSSTASGGCIYLISGGTSAYDSYLVDASASGDDVFFIARDQLVPQDQNDNLDLYDARVGGGFPFTPAPAPCTGGGCRPPSAAPPSPPTAASVTFSGLGNATPSTTTGKVEVLHKTVRGSKFVLSVKVPAKGRITVSGVGLRTVRRSVIRAGTYRLTVTLTAKERQKLKRKKRLKLKLRVGYAPSSGSASSATVSVTVKAG